MRFLKFGWGDDDDTPSPKPKADLTEWRSRERKQKPKPRQTSEKTPHKSEKTQRKNRGAKISWSRPNIAGERNE